MVTLHRINMRLTTRRCMEKESMENKEEEGCSAGETAGKYRTMTMRKKYTLAIAILGIL